MNKVDKTAPSAATENLTELLHDLLGEAESETVTVGDLLEKLETRGFGALLLILSLIVLLPTGAIPGVPGLCGTLICLCSVQILAGRRRPWLPQRLKRLSANRAHFNAAIRKVMPLARRIDSLLHARLPFLTSRIAECAMAMASIVLALLMFPLGFIPFAAMLPAFVILLFAVGLTFRDGAFVAAAFTVLAAASATLFHLALPFWI